MSSLSAWLHRGCRVGHQIPTSAGRVQSIGAGVGAARLDPALLAVGSQ